MVLYVLDEATRYTWVQATPSRVAGLEWFKQLIPRLEHRSGRVLQELVSDNAPEFVSAEFNRYLGERGIHHVYSVAHEQNHNGAVERLIRTVTTASRKLLADAALPACFWPHAVPHAAHLYNA